jgi:hypothetical protein
MVGWVGSSGWLGEKKKKVAQAQIHTYNTLAIYQALRELIG